MWRRQIRDLGGDGAVFTELPNYRRKPGLIVELSGGRATLQISSLFTIPLLSYSVTSCSNIMICNNMLRQTLQFKRACKEVAAAVICSILHSPIPRSIISKMAAVFIEFAPNRNVFWSSIRFWSQVSAFRPGPQWGRVDNYLCLRLQT